MAQTVDIFDRVLVRRRRAAAAPRLSEYGFLHREAALRLVERLADIRRDFATALAFGWDAAEVTVPASTVLYADLAPARAAQAPGPGFAADEEALPVKEASLDLVLSNLCLHWVNDLPGALVQMNRALLPDGLFLAALLGGDTLFELRQALMEAELEVAGGARPRVSPMAELRDLGGLLQRAGFAMPVADAETVTVSYDNAFALMRDVRAMGEANAARERQKNFARRALFLRAAELYAERHADAEGRVPATFQLIFLTGWAPGPGQPRPKRPGSATARLADALGTEEVPVPGRQGR